MDVIQLPMLYCVTMDSQTKASFQSFLMNDSTFGYQIFSQLVLKFILSRRIVCNCRFMASGEPPPILYSREDNAFCPSSTITFVVHFGCFILFLCGGGVLQFYKSNKLILVFKFVISNRSNLTY